MASNLKADSYSFFYRLPKDSPDIPLILEVLESPKLEGGPIPYRVTPKETVTEIWLDSTRLEDARKFVY